MVADAVGVHVVLGAGFLAEVNHELDHSGREVAAVAVALVEGENLTAVRRLPLVEHGNAVTGPHVVVAGNAALGQNRRGRPEVAEGVREVAYLHVLRVHIEVLFEKLPGVEQMAAKRLAGNHVHIALNPCRGGDFPPALFYPLFDHLEDVGAVLAHGRVCGGLALGIAKLRELVHDVVHGGEGVVGDVHRLLPAPHPVHIDMGVAHTVDGVLLRLFGDGSQDFLTGFHGGLRVLFDFRHNRFGGLNRQFLPLLGFVREQVYKLPNKVNLVVEAGAGIIDFSLRVDSSVESDIAELDFQRVDDFCQSVFKVHGILNSYLSVL